MKNTKTIVYAGLFIAILNGLFSIHLSDTCIRNYGFAFGLELEYIVYVSIVLIAFLFLLAYFLKGLYRHLLLAVALLGLSNWFVRVGYGYVCYYIKVYNVHINVADIGIVICVLIGIYFLFTKDESRNR